MRRKVRGTVLGIYMYSAALGVFSTPSRLHGCHGSAVLQQNGFCAFFLQNTPQIGYITSLAHLCERSSAEGPLLIPRDNLTMNQWSIVKRSRRTLD